MTPLDGVCVCVWMSGINTESLAVGHCRVCVRGVPRFLHAKDLICRFRNRGCIVAATKDSIFHPYFSVTVKSH